MTEHHRTVQRQQALRLHGVRGRLRDPELLRGAPQKRRVADRFCGRQEQQPPRVAREPRQPPREALLDPGGQRQRRGQAEAAGELGGRQPARELQERERIPARLGDDPLEHGLVQPRRAGRTPAAPAHPGAPAARRGAAGSAASPWPDVTRREHERDPLRQQTASHERERARRRAVEPLCVVDHAQERLLLGSFREEPEDREPDEKRARRRSGAEPERDGERVALRIGQTLDELEDRRTELLERRVVELHLPLDARGPDDAEVLARLDRVLEQRGLADAGVAVHDEDGAVTVPRGIQQPLEHLALALPAEQPPGLRPDDHPAQHATRVTDYGFPGFDRPGCGEPRSVP